MPEHPAQKPGRRVRARGHIADKPSGCTPARWRRPLHLQTPPLSLAPLHPERGHLRGCSWEGGGWPRGARQRARLGRGARQAAVLSRGGGRREGAAAAAAASSPAATQTPGAAEAVSRSACPRLLRSQSGVGVAARAGVRGAVAPRAAAGGTQRLRRGGRRGGHVERAGLGTCPYSPSRLRFTLSIPLSFPHVSEGKENKTEDLENGWQKRREQLCRGTRRGARGWQDGARWVGRGRSRAWRLRDLRSIPPRRGVGSRIPAGSQACRVGPERPQEACARGGGLRRGFGSD